MIEAERGIVAGSRLILRAGLMPKQEREKIVEGTYLRFTIQHCSGC